MTFAKVPLCLKQHEGTECLSIFKPQSYCFNNWVIFQQKHSECLPFKTTIYSICKVPEPWSFPLLILPFPHLLPNCQLPHAEPNCLFVRIHTNVYLIPHRLSIRTVIRNTLSLLLQTTICKNVLGSPKLSLARVFIYVCALCVPPVSL